MTDDKEQKRKNLALFAVLLSLAVILFVTTFIKFGHAQSDIHSSSSDDITLALRRENVALGNVTDTDLNKNRY